MTKESRLALIAARVRNRKFPNQESSISTLDELPEADTRDLEEAAQYQSTIDADFES